MIYYVKIENEKDYDEFGYNDHNSRLIRSYLPAYFEISGAIFCVGCTINKAHRYLKNYKNKNFLTFDEWKLIKAMEENVSTN